MEELSVKRLRSIHEASDQIGVGKSISLKEILNCQ
jgi:hypothetical protein